MCQPGGIATKKIASVFASPVSMTLAGESGTHFQSAGVFNPWPAPGLTQIKAAITVTPAQCIFSSFMRRGYALPILFQFLRLGSFQESRDAISGHPNGGGGCDAWDESGTDQESRETDRYLTLAPTLRYRPACRR